MKQTESIMELSTAHITPAMAKLLDEHQIDLSYFTREEGYFISTIDGLDGLDDCPDDLKQCITYAQENDCIWLLFDCDVDPMPKDLPVYNWKTDENDVFSVIEKAWNLKDTATAAELAVMLMDDDISTTYMMRDIATSYTPDKSQDFRDGFNRAFEILLERDVKAVCEHLIKTCKKSEDEEGGEFNG